MRIITEFATAKKLLNAKKTLYPSSKSLNIEESSQPFHPALQLASLTPPGTLSLQYLPWCIPPIHIKSIRTF